MAAIDNIAAAPNPFSPFSHLPRTSTSANPERRREHSRKRQKIVQVVQSPCRFIEFKTVALSPRSSAKSINDRKANTDKIPRNFLMVLPEEVSENIWSMLGNGHYRYIAGVHSSFRDSYTAFCCNLAREAKQTDGSTNTPRRYTVPSNIVQSVACARFYVKDQQRRRKQPLSLEDRQRLMPVKGLGEFATWEIMSIDSPWTDVAHLAAAYGKRDVLKYALEEMNASVQSRKRARKVTYSSMKAGMVTPSLQTHSTRRKTNICKLAALSGDLPTLQYARETEGLPWNSQVCKIAAYKGHLQMLEWARQKGCPWDEEVCEMAAQQGRLHIIEWARGHGCPWSPMTCAQAASNGHLELLKWLRAKDCPWNILTCHHAAKGGHLDVLTWAHTHGCEWNEQTALYAAQHGHWEVAQWLVERRDLDHQFRTTSLCAEATRQGRWDALEWLREYRNVF